jgi:hypothetical protein
LGDFFFDFGDDFCIGFGEDFFFGFGELFFTLSSVRSIRALPRLAEVG